MGSSFCVFNYQFDTNQWTRYLLFASWVLMAVSAVVGISSLVSPPELGSEKGEARVGAPASAADSEAEEEGEGETRTAAEGAARPGLNAAYAFTLAQAVTFVLGLMVYVVYTSWLILGLQAYPSPGL